MWHELRTLGEKNKLFQWRFLSNEPLTIRRFFADGTEHITEFTAEEIEKVMAFVEEKGPVPLVNNVEKLHMDNERDGLGRFVFKTLRRDVLDAQATSQLAAIFVHVGLFSWNGLKRGMCFTVANGDWQSRLNPSEEKALPLELQLCAVSLATGDISRAAAFYSGIFDAPKASGRLAFRWGIYR